MIDTCTTKVYHSPRSKHAQIVNANACMRQTFVPKATYICARGSVLPAGCQLPNVSNLSMQHNPSGILRAHKTGLIHGLLEV